MKRVRARRVGEVRSVVVVVEMRRERSDVGLERGRLLSAGEPEVVERAQRARTTGI